MWEKLNEPVKIGFFLKLMIMVNFMFLAMCFKICWVRTTQDQEHLEYDTYLEYRIELQSELIQLQQKLINEYQK